MLALRRGKLDEAQAGYVRMADIYRAVHGGHHDLIGVALSNLASVEFQRQNFKKAESLLREALEMYSELPPDHQNVAITRLKLGRALLRQGRFEEAERETRPAYEILVAQLNPASSWLTTGRADLVEEYEGLKRPQEADKFRTAAEPTP